ncbi:MAG TPA: ABC transporter permease [Nitriliruptorales bacterium]|nr:ABC transporter permease [Nitriliruptorales bacterium]
MFAFVTRRLVTTIPLLLVATFLIYVLVSITGNPLARLATCTTCDPAAFQRIIELYELDRPIPVRYVGWVTGAVTGDLGTSTSLGAGTGDVLPILIDRAVNTAKLAVPAFLIIATLAISLGVYSAVRQYSLSDYTITGLSFLGISMPVFFFALLLQVVFGVWLRDWVDVKPFYVAGMRSGSFTEYLRSATLPVMTLVFVLTASESRFQRASMLEVIHSDYIRTAKAKGLSRRRVVFKHALRNALIPLVTIWALDFASLLGGSVVTETVFSWPGLGPALLRGISEHDLDLTMAIVLFVATLTIVFNLVADVLYGFLDPRIRYD